MFWNPSVRNLSLHSDLLVDTVGTSFSDLTRGIFENQVPPQLQQAGTECRGRANRANKQDGAQILSPFLLQKAHGFFVDKVSV